MDDVQQLGEMLRHYADSEAHKKQLFESQSAVWATRIGELFDQIQQWLEPVQAPNLLEVSREAYVASGPSVPVETSTFKTEKLGIVIAGGTDGSYGDGDDSARVRPGSEVEALVASGLTPMQAITAVTLNSARVLGIEARTGSIAAGLEADLLVVARDPREDTSTLFEPMLIINNGELVLNRLY